MKSEVAMLELGFEVGCRKGVWKEVIGGGWRRSLSKGKPVDMCPWIYV